MFRHYPLDYELKAVARPDLLVQLGAPLPVELQPSLFGPVRRRHGPALEPGGRGAVLPAVAAHPHRPAGHRPPVRGRRRWSASLLWIHRLYAVETMSWAEFHLRFGWNVFYQRTDFRADDLMWGVLLAFLWVRVVARAGAEAAGLGRVTFVFVFIFVGKQYAEWTYRWGLPALALSRSPWCSPAPRPTGRPSGPSRPDGSARSASCPTASTSGTRWRSPWRRRPWEVALSPCRWCPDWLWRSCSPC